MPITTTKISELALINSIEGGEIFPIVQNGVTKKITTNDLKNYIKELEITSFECKDKIYEVGDILPFNTIKWSFNKIPSKLSLTLGNGCEKILINTDTSFVDGNKYEVNEPCTKTWTIKGNSGGVEKEKTNKVEWIYPFFLGMSSIDLSSGGKLLYKNLIKDIDKKANKMKSFFGKDKFVYYAYPSSYGNLTQILDENGFNILDSFDKNIGYVESVDKKTNWKEKYIIYKSKTTKIVPGGSIYQFKFQDEIDDLKSEIISLKSQLAYLKTIIDKLPGK